MHRSELDEIYSLSGKYTRKEMLNRLPGDKKINRDLGLALNKYIDPYTKKVLNEYISLRTKCPLCDSINFRFIFVKEGFDHMVCNDCDLIFTLQILDNNKVGHLEEGQEGDNYGKYKELPEVNNLDRKKFEIVFEQLKQNSDIKKIFDFGSQVGTFLDWCKEQGYGIIGHEYHEPLRQIGIKKDHTVLNENLETIQFENELDLITCWDYLDHVLNPKIVIKNLTKHLKKGGLFFFAINNRDSLSVRMMHEHSPVFIGPHHTMHFGISQLKLLMEGYELVHSESYVSELNWLSNWLNFKNPGEGDAKLMTELLDPKKISELGMGFKVNAIFRKI